MYDNRLKSTMPNILYFKTLELIDIFIDYDRYLRGNSI